MKILSDVLRKLPKVDLHCHLDGSVRTGTLFDIMKKKTSLPCSTVEEFAEFVHVSPACRTLTEFLNKFEFFYPYLKSPEVMERIAYELCEDSAAENIRYLEVRFAPCLQADDKISQEDILRSVLSGLKKGSRDFDIISAAILCVYRGTPPGAWEETYRLAEKYIGSGIAGLDLAGDESKYPSAPFKEVFDKAYSAGLPVTIHAGEASGWESVRDAVDILHARRIGHGVRISENSVFFDRIKEMKIPLEICITSNIHTGVFRDYASHPVKDFYRKGIRVTLNSDDRGVSNIDLTYEWGIAQKECGLEIEDILDININSAEAAFCAAGEKNKLKEKIQKESREVLGDILG